MHDVMVGIMGVLVGVMVWTITLITPTKVFASWP